MITSLNYRAVVIGGSMAGLLAARVLADYFTEVVVVERDRLPEEPISRPGLPQARHVHLLLARGRDIMEQFFPGLQEDLLRHGAQCVDVIRDVKWWSPTGWAIRFPSGITTPACARDLLDWTIRRRLAAYPQIQFRPEAEVIGLTATADHTTVTGVRIVPRTGDRAEEILQAALVVDASGRQSKAPQWLQALGYSIPSETVIRAFIGYASRIYARSASGPWQGLLMQPTPPDNLRGGAVFPLDATRWIVTLSGAGGDYPPTDEEGFLAYAHSLRHPLLYETIAASTPLSPIAGNRSTENRWRHYERLARQPEAFLVLGDAVYAFNPVYGQGMTAAALDAQALDTCLRAQWRHAGTRRLRGLARRFQRELAKVNRPIWMLATGEDFRYPQAVGGRRPLWMHVMHGYIDQVIRQAARNPTLYRRMAEVIHLRQPPVALLTPRILIALLNRPPKEQPNNAW